MGKTWITVLILMIAQPGYAVAMGGDGGAHGAGHHEDHDIQLSDEVDDADVAAQLEMLKMMDMLEHFDLIRDMEMVEGEDEQ